MQLIIFETLEEAKGVFAERREMLGGGAVLCFNPKVQAWLAERGIKSCNTADVTDTNSHQLMMDKCLELENLCKQELLGLENKPPRYFIDAYFHFLRLTWRHFIWTIEVVSRAIDAGGYDRVIVCQHELVSCSSPWIEDAQLYVGYLAEKLCRQKGLVFQTLAIKNTVPEVGSREKKVSFFEPLYQLVSFLLLKIYVWRLRNKKKLLVPNFKYNLGRVCDELRLQDPDLKIGCLFLGKRGLKGLVQAAGLLVYNFIGKKIERNEIGYPADYAVPILAFAHHFQRDYDGRAATNYLVSIVETIKIFKGKEAVYKNVDIADILLKKISEDINPYMLKLDFHSYGLFKALEVFCPSVIVSQMSLELPGALGYFAHKLKIPSVLISHGSHVFNPDRYAAREHEILAKNILIGEYGVLAVQSPHAWSLAEKLASKGQKIVKIKPALWGTGVPPRRQQEKKNSLLLVFAGTFKLRHNRRYIYETSDEFLAAVKSLVRAVKGKEKLKLIIKIRPDTYELPQGIIEEVISGTSNVVIESQRPFNHVLGEADLLISFSSTTIEEALVNNVPVLLFGGGGRYAHIPTKPYVLGQSGINEAVSYVASDNDLEQFLKCLNDNWSDFAVQKEKFCYHNFDACEIRDLKEVILREATR